MTPAAAAAAPTTHIDQRAVARLRSEPLPLGTKGLPLGDRDRWTIDSIAQQGWNVLAGDLPLPLLTLQESALGHNIATMAAYCRERDIRLAPHGKTTMAPQIFERQIAAGCWAMTAATPTHLSLYRSFGIGRILYANELVEPTALRWLASELNVDDGFEFYCLVDSVEGVERMTSVLEGDRPRTPVNALIEIGHTGGRAGCRTLDDVDAVADAVARSPSLRLAGVEAFEGTVDTVTSTRWTDPDGTFQQVDALVARVATAARTLAKRGMLDTGRDVIVSAGGSAFFDLVVNALSPLRSEVPRLQLVLRSGCYVAHDGGYYDRASPLGQRAPSGSPTLEAALELWSVVLSRPEPGLAIVGAGKRDLPIDMGPPVPTRTWSARNGMQTLSSQEVSVSSVSDQHVHLRIDPELPLEVGDLCAWTISHPCTAFDKWRLIPIVDDDLTVVDAVRTFF
jgi:D-serine dehydratase